MATKTVNIKARIQPDIKESAEAILEKSELDLLQVRRERFT